MKIYLNVNDLVEQLIELTKDQNEAMKKVSVLSSELNEVKDKLMMKELEDEKSRVDFERELSEMAKDYESRDLSDILPKIING